MKILIAEDDAFSRKLLMANLDKLGHEVVACVDGDSAVKAYEQDPSFNMAILDWMMPGKSGIEVCMRIKDNAENPLTYVIMLTAKSSPEDLALALESGADDFIAKPFNSLEFNARVDAGIRMIRLQGAMMDNIQELEETLAHVERLQGIIPICAWCKKIRDDSEFWRSVEDYFSEHSGSKFSHSICPECLQECTYSDNSDICS